MASLTASPQSAPPPVDSCATTATIRIAPPRSLGLPRAALFLRLARRQNPLQTDGHRRPLGHLAARSEHARLYSFLRPPRQAPLRRPPLSCFLLRGAHPLDLFRHVPPDHH